DRGADGLGGARGDAGGRRGRLSYAAVQPPSTTYHPPVQKEAASDAMNATSSATSSGRPSRPIGCFATSGSRSDGSESKAALASGVSITPGPTQLIRIPSAAYSSAAERVRPRTPCFEAT